MTWASAWRLEKLFEAREVSPVEVLEHFLGRIETHQPTLRAFEHLDGERARADADAAERRLQAGDRRGFLDGIPVAVKGHIPMQGRPLSQPFDVGPERLDDVVVERLRAAGAVIVGHTTMPRYTSDLSAFDWHATARNPWDPERSPGVSSAGGAAAVAAGLLPAVINSDGAGSSRLPAAYSGTVGVHPTPGLVPWVDHRHYATRLGSTLGPMTRDVRDAAEILSVIAGPDGRDHIGLQVELPDPRGQLGLGAAGLRVAWSDDFGFARAYAVEESDRVIEHIRHAALALRDLGATVEPTKEVWPDYIPAALTHGVVYTGMPIMGPEAGAAISDEDWDHATRVRQDCWSRFRRLFGECDLLVTPTVNSIAPTVEALAARAPVPVFTERNPHTDSYTVYTSIFNWLNFPATSVPCGFVDEMPVGLQIAGPPGSDATIFRLAQAYLDAFPLECHPAGF
jgi:Asp-tRNA(Asn)/Glu-tRNA(Gln) amidotransferase A subunit family amidase